jgi:hypothetical protein
VHLRCTGGQSRGDKPPNRRGSQSCSDIRRQLKRRSVLAFFEARRQAGCQARSVANECAVSWLVPACLQCFTAA